MLIMATRDMMRNMNCICMISNCYVWHEIDNVCYIDLHIVYEILRILLRAGSGRRCVARARSDS